MARLESLLSGEVNRFEVNKMSVTTDLTAAKRTFKIPIQAYDMASGQIISADRYLSGQPMDADL